MRQSSLRTGAMTGLLMFGLASSPFFPASLLPAAQAQKAGVATSRVALNDSVLGVVNRATLLQHLDSQNAKRVIVALKFPHPEAIEAYNAAISDPKSPLYRQFLTPEEIGERFGPAKSDYDAVIAHLKANGFAIERTHASRMSVWAQGTPAQIESAFGVKMNVYRESPQDALARPNSGGKPQTFFSNDGPVQLPSNISGVVQVVDGLQNYTHPLRLLKKAKKASSPFAPADVRTAYGTASLYSAGYTGSGRTIGISNWDGVNPKNAGTYCTHYSLPTSITSGAPTLLSIHNVSGDTTSTSGSGEGDLDPQMALGQAPLATVIIYSNPDGSSPLAVLTLEVSDNKADIISESYGWALSASVITSCHNEHTMMTTQGQTYLCASGDSGSSIGKYYYPDGDPNITVVGGTTLTVGSNGARSSEPGWADSGGGYSAKEGFSKPTWQVGTGVPSTNYRLFPDIASNANGTNGAYSFYYSGAFQTGYVGTSFASPATAGMLALAEQSAIAAGKITSSGGHYRVGNINPLLYGFDGSATYFYDVTSGSNGKYSAGKGWDYVTGWGAINFAALAGAL